MKTKFITLTLIAFFTMPVFLCAEVIEIPLMDIAQIGFVEGASPFDGPEQSPDVPTRPTDFRATINGNSLTILKQEEAIPSAQAVVVNAATGRVVVNEQFTNSLSEQIATPGVYVLRISTADGALTGQFIVE